MNFAIQILNFNNYKVTIKSIQAIMHNNYNNLDIFILDNGSSNNSYIKLLEFIKKEKRECNIFIKSSKENLGYPGGQNYIYRWIEEIKPKNYNFYFLLNSDALIPNDFFKKFINHYIKMKERNLIYGFSIYDPENKGQSFIIQSWNKYFGFGRKHSLIPSVLSNSSWQYYPSGCALMISSKFFKKIGVHDENLFFYGDEVDMSFKLSSIGESFTIFKDITIEHSYGKSTFIKKQKRNLFNEFYYQRAKIIIMNKYFPSRVILVRLSLIPILFWRLFFGYFNHLPLLLKIFFLPVSRLKSTSFEDFKIK
jgi:GT2 family glycosyltransferase